MHLSTRELPFLVAVLILLLASPVHAVDLNGYRKANGLKPMRAHAALGALAKAHAADMARRGRMDHAGFTTCVPGAAPAPRTSHMAAPI